MHLQNALKKIITLRRRDEIILLFKKKEEEEREGGNLTQNAIRSLLTIIVILT